MEWTWGRWSLDMTTKLALGTSQEKAILSGQTTVYPASGPGTSAPGGILVTSANSGEYYQSPFAVVPELDLNLAYAVTPNISVRLGYSFIYWSNVLRPGDQVNRLVSPNLIPSDNSYGQAGANQPQYQFASSSYWAQGLNVGLDFHFLVLRALKRRRLPTRLVAGQDGCATGGKMFIFLWPASSQATTRRQKRDQT